MSKKHFVYLLWERITYVVCILIFVHVLHNWAGFIRKDAIENTIIIIIITTIIITIIIIIIIVAIIIITIITIIIF